MQGMREYLFCDIIDTKKTKKLVRKMANILQAW